MSTGICSCGSPSFGNTGRPNCVIEQKVLAFPVIAPRFKKDGSRNTIDLAQDPLTIADSNGATGNYATIGAYILDRVENTNWSAQDRFYALPKPVGSDHAFDERLCGQHPKRRLADYLSV